MGRFRGGSIAKSQGRMDGCRLVSTTTPHPTPPLCRLPPRSSSLARSIICSTRAGSRARSMPRSMWTCARPTSLATRSSRWPVAAPPAVPRLDAGGSRAGLLGRRAGWARLVWSQCPTAYIRPSRAPLPHRCLGLALPVRAARRRAALCAGWLPSLCRERRGHRGHLHQLHRCVQPRLGLCGACAAGPHQRPGWHAAAGARGRELQQGHGDGAGRASPSPLGGAQSARAPVTPQHRFRNP